MQTFAKFLACLTVTAASTAFGVTADDLRVMSQPELDAIYLAADAGEMPDGESDGTAVFFAGSIINTPTQLLAALIWQGKVFDTDDGILVNKVFGFRAIKAELYKGPSLLDGRESNIIDYSRTSLLAHAVRDEIREVAPNLYLGRAYLRTLLGDFMVVNFVLEFE
jgi:hypothetical protein